MQRGRAVVVAVVLGVLHSFAELSSPAQPLQVVGQSRSAGLAGSPESRKIVSRLRALIADYQVSGMTPERAAVLDAVARFSSVMPRVDAAGRVHVDVTVADTSEAALNALRQHGLDVEIVNATFGIVEGWIPLANLEALAAEPAVSKIRPPSYGTTRTGSVNSQGDAIHRCDVARAGGATGSGVMVGVISDGVSGLAASQASGNLGAVTVLSPGSGDEGTAILEIVHDCAPGAALAFASGLTSMDFINSVNNLGAIGAKVIVDDVGFYGEPYFQDGTIALNDRAVGAVVLRVAAAGNDRKAHYQGMFSPGLFDSEIPGTRHIFGGGDTLMQFRVAGGAVATIVLQWANPFGAAGDDYDLCVRQGGVLKGCSALVQDGNDDPIEALVLSCPAPAGSFCVADIQITLFSGVARTLKLFCLRCTLDEFGVAAGSIFGHAAVPEVVAVAASPASSPTTIESFSSAGPSTVLFPGIETRAKPDLTGTDGVATSRPAPFNPFFGTSAAAPHVAGVAALVLEKNGTLTPAQTRTILASSAVNLGVAGFDSDSGFGRADAVNALAATPPPVFGGGIFLASGHVTHAGGAAQIVTGPGPGRVAEVRVFDADGTQRVNYQVYGAGFKGGVRVAACDLDGDGRDEIVSVTGPGGGPHVRVMKFDAAGNYVGDLANFFAYEPGFVGGLFIACGDLDGDGIPDLILGVDAGGGPHLRIFRYTPGAPGNVSVLFEAFVYPAGFRGGIRVAAGDVDGSGRASLIVGAGPGGGPHVRVFRWNGSTLVETAGWYAYAPSFPNGIFVAAGDVLGTGRAQVLTGADAGGGPHVRVWSATGADTGIGFFAYGPAFTGGVRVATGDINGAGAAEILTGAGPGGGPHVGTFTGTGTPIGAGFLAY